MPSPVFPNLSCGPDFPLQKKPVPNTITSGYEAGYEQKRKRFTRPLYDYPRKYPILTAADKDLLQAHIDAVEDIEIFPWTDEDGNAHNVRYLEKPAIEKAGPLHWSCEFTLREV